MKASYQWLQEYTDVRGDVQMLADRLTMAGIPVEEVYDHRNEIKNVVTGKLLSVNPHPNADKLVVCEVDTGDETVQICTGADNVRAGQIVPVAKHNSYLPGGVHIKKSKLRGLPSCGMLCSARELGLDVNLLTEEERHGILVMPEDTPVGADIRKFYGLGDCIFEFELTPNRADCFSMVGLARELAAVFDGSCTILKPVVEESDESINGAAHIVVEDVQLCPRFTARLLRNVRVMPSPQWLKERLRTAGIRSINNVVDVTNYVMHELGLPLHAYDYDTLAGHTLICRRAYEGETLITLDEQERTLDSSHLVIADTEQAAGLAGIMGGLRTEVTTHTTSVLLEAAAFDGATIRRTSRKVGLRSEASGRYERGVDVTMTRQALDRAAQLLQQMKACTVAQGYLDSYTSLPEPQELRVTHTEISQAIGIELTAEEITDYLHKLCFEVQNEDNVMKVKVPLWRQDVSGMADIVEEIARLHGYDRIPATMPRVQTQSGHMSDLQACAEDVKNALLGLGLSETVSFSFMDVADIDKLRCANDDLLRMAVPIKNPITEDMPIMRTTLIPGLMKVLQRNLAVKNENVAIFEYGTVFTPRSLPMTELPIERKLLSGLVCGAEHADAWNATADAMDFYTVKGWLQEILRLRGINEYAVERADEPYYHPGKSAKIVVNGKTIMTWGEAHPLVMEKAQISKTICLFTVDMQALSDDSTTTPVYQALPKHPGVERDLAILVPQDTLQAEIEQMIRLHGGEMLQSIHLFDYYTGERIPKGAVSLAYALQFRASDRTLTDEEVDAYMNRIVAALADKGYHLR